MTLPTLQKILEYTPFLLSVNQPQLKFNVQRLVEAVIIGLVSGYIISLVAIAKLETRVDNIIKNQDRLEKRVEKFHP